MKKQCNKDKEHLLDALYLLLYNRKVSRTSYYIKYFHCEKLHSNFSKRRTKTLDFRMFVADTMLLMSAFVLIHNIVAIL